MTSRGYLLDSQVLVWLMSEKGQIGPRTRQIIERGEVYFSVISVAELQFKARLGKLKLQANAVSAWTELGFGLLNFNLEAAEEFWSFSVYEVPDPMDRQIMAIARANNLTLLTSDRKILSQSFPWAADATS
jgi:PIN domain nuclease of toxin-antitoxin system